MSAGAPRFEVEQTVAGIQTLVPGVAPLTLGDRQAFANRLDRFLTQSTPAPPA